MAKKPPAKSLARVIEYLPLDDLIDHPDNPKQHDVELVDASVSRFGVIDVIVRDERTGYTISGHGRTKSYRAQRERGENPPDGVLLSDDGAWLVPVVTGWASHSDTEAAAALVALNRVGEVGGWVDDSLLQLLDDLAGMEDGLAGVGYGDDDLDALRAQLADLAYSDLTGSGAAAGGGDPPSLADRFIVPPFSILDARSGVWQERKRRWLSLGIQSELGRGGTGTLGVVQDNLDGVDAERYGRKKIDARTYHLGDLDRGSTSGRTLAQGLQAHRDPDTGELVYTETTAAGISIFDPVICELAYRWFCPPGGTVLDPFAGGSVRGIIAAALGHPYVGVELRTEQVAANERQRPILAAMPDAAPVTWHTGDSAVVLPTLDVHADLVFSCPPYADLEVYSDDPADISNMPYDQFLTIYRDIIREACAHLQDDRFAVWVVGEVRDSRGVYRSLVPDTIQAFQDAGLSYYNEAILVTPAGSLPLRAGRQFAGGRKLGRTHQTVLVFCKGDWRRATETCGTVDVTWPEPEEDG